MSYILLFPKQTQADALRAGGEMTFQERLQVLLQDRGDVRENIPREQMIRECVANGDAMVSACGALATNTIYWPS